MATSIEKVRALAGELGTMPAEGTTALVLLTAQQALPQVLALLPSDPGELDAMLESVGAFVLGLRSDPDPEPPAIPGQTSIVDEAA